MTGYFIAETRRDEGKDKLVPTKITHKGDNQLLFSAEFLLDADPEWVSLINGVLTLKSETNMFQILMDDLKELGQVIVGNIYSGSLIYNQEYK